MSKTETCQLTTKDYSILKVMLERYLGRDETMSATFAGRFHKRP